MSEQLSPLSIAPGILTKETLPLGIVALKVSNTSPYDLSYSGYGASGDDVIPSGVENILYGAVYNSGVFQATLVNNRNITPANAGVVLLVAYYSNSEIPQGSWPVSIPTSTVNVSGNTGVTTSQFLQNDTSNAGTVFIESTVGANQATKVTVDGIWNLSIIIAGVLHKLLTSQTSGSQLVLGQISDIVEVASNLIADGTLSVKGASSFDNGSAFTDGAGNFTIQDLIANTTLQVLGATHLDSGNIFTDGLGNLSVSGTINTGNLSASGTINTGNPKLSSSGYTGISGDQLSRLGNSAGTGSGTFNHNLGAVPDFVAITTHANGSQTVGYHNETSTQITVVTGASLSWFAFLTKRS